VLLTDKENLGSSSRVISCRVLGIKPSGTFEQRLNIQLYHHTFPLRMTLFAVSQISGGFERAAIHIDLI